MDLFGCIRWSGPRICYVGITKGYRSRAKIEWSLSKGKLHGTPRQRAYKDATTSFKCTTIQAQTGYTDAKLPQPFSDSGGLEDFSTASPKPNQGRRCEKQWCNNKSRIIFNPGHLQHPTASKPSTRLPLAWFPTTSPSKTSWIQ